VLLQARCVAAVEGDSRDTFLVGTAAPKGVRDSGADGRPCNDLHLLELNADAVRCRLRAAWRGAAASCDAGACARLRAHA